MNKLLEIFPSEFTWSCTNFSDREKEEYYYYTHLFYFYCPKNSSTRLHNGRSSHVFFCGDNLFSVNSKRIIAHKNNHIHPLKSSSSSQSHSIILFRIPSYSPHKINERRISSVEDDLKFTRNRLLTIFKPTYLCALFYIHNNIQPPQTFHKKRIINFVIFSS